MGKMGFLQNTTPDKQAKIQTLIVPDDFTHSYTVGKTGCGKTSSYIYPNLDDRIKNGNGLILFDHKGKEHQAVKYFAKKYNRLDDIIEIGLPWGSKCNMIAYFNPKELKLFVAQIMSLGSENDYWITSASNIIVSLYNIIKSYIDVMKSTDDHNIQDTLYSAIKRHRLPTRLTFSDLADIVSSHKKLAQFVVSVKRVNDRFNAIIEGYIQDLVMQVEASEIKDMYLDIVTKNIHFTNVVKAETKSLRIFVDSNNDSSGKSSTLQTIILSMSSTFSAIATNENINDYNGLDIAAELNKGKILIINSQELSNIVLGTLTSSILQELSKRVQQPNIRPISVFIDEAQRVVNKKMDLHTDVLRESKVEILLAFQNHNLMINAIGKDKFYALIQNLSSSYIFANSIDFNEYETSKLETFEYYHKDTTTVHTAKPMFLDPDDLFDASLQYCTDNKLYDKLNIEMKHRDKVIQFNPYLYQHNSVELKSRDGEIIVVQLRDASMEQEAVFVIQDIIGMHKIKLKNQNVHYSPPERSLMSLLNEEIKKKDIDEFMGVKNE